MPRADAMRQHSTHISDIRSERGGFPEEPELEFVNRVGVVALKDAFTPQQWHRPYAEALLSGHSTQLPAAVTLAQRAILNRYLELAAASETQPGEATDLSNAVDVLQGLKRTTDRTW
jgi:hypothetical protein